MLHVLLSIIHPRLTTGGRAWLDAELSAIAAGASAERITRAYTAASRQAGRATLNATDDELLRVWASDRDLSLSNWTVDDAARAVLLLAVEGSAPQQLVDVATACYEGGDAREQQSWLRSLPLLPDAGRFLPTAIDACRTNIVPLFEAIACENPYPARYFPDRNFNQLVLKALFNSIATARIVRLSTRLNAELSRMAGDYAAERRAAGRQVPPDIHVFTPPASEDTRQESR